MNTETDAQACTQVILCGEAASDGRQADVSDRVLRLRSAGPDRNVNLQIGDISQSLCGRVPAQLTDLIEIATYV